MQITGGRVLFGRTVQPAQYESKKSEVELSFVLAENEELGGALEEIGKIVKAEALHLVGIEYDGNKEIRDDNPRRRGRE